MPKVETSRTAVASTCMLCNSPRLRLLCSGVRDFEHGAPGAYDWVECSDCALIRLRPEPTDEELQIAESAASKHSPNRPSILVASLNKVLQRRFAKRVAELIEDGGAILEVGCAEGERLLDIQRIKPCEIYGVEKNADAAQAARERGITVWQEDLKDADIPPNTMDVVIVRDVLEQQRNPVETLKRLFRCTKSGGHIVGQLPNFDSWDAQLFQQYWGGGRAPRHLFQFTPKSATTLLEACGYQNVKIKPSPNTTNWALSVQNYFRKDASALSTAGGGRAWYYPPLLMATVPINALQMALLKTGTMQFEAEKA